MSNHARCVVVVSASAATRATVALNLAAALSVTGRRVSLRDHEGMVRATLGAASNDVTLPGTDGAGGAFTLVRSGESVNVTCELFVAYAADAGDDAVADAHLLLVPVDATPDSASTLEQVAKRVCMLDPAPRVRVVMARTLPRGVDRWALVERVAEAMPGALHGSTIPVTRRAVRDAPGAALLYASGTRAAHAYRTLASEVLAHLE